MVAGAVSPSSVQYIHPSPAKDDVAVERTVQ
jgi:hypothetical protein